VTTFIDELTDRGLWSPGMEYRLSQGECPVDGCDYFDAWVFRGSYVGPLFSTHFLDHVQAHLGDRSSRRAA